jgi:threonine/homoserine/homoserine lactone efflux protein
MGSLDLSVIAFVMAIYFMAVVTPGPAFLFMSRLSLQGRRATGFGAVFGIAIATSIYAIIAMTGLAFLLDQLRWLARGVQIAGGLYLIYLGVQAWRAARHGLQDDAPDLPDALQRRKDFWSGLRMGLLVAFSNPKGVLFFVSLYAAAIPIDASLATKGVILIGGTSMEILWYGATVVLLSRPAVGRLYRRAAAWIERVIGTLLAAFGIRLILDRT